MDDDARGRDDRQVLRLRRPESNYPPLLRVAQIPGYSSGVDEMVIDLVRAKPEL